jgi:hypothetical protein
MLLLDFRSLLFFLVWVPCLLYQKDIRNHKDWVGNHYQSGDAVVVTLNEPLIEKTKSFQSKCDL